MQKQPSRYIDIAIQVAMLIVNGEFSEGDKVSGRSTLATRYNVSPETVRRAIALLKDFGVVDSEPKHGITIVSAHKAKAFISTYNKRRSILQAKQEIVDIVNLRKEQDNLLLERLQTMIEEISAPRDMGAITPMELILPPKSSLINKSLIQCDFWNKTGSTIIAVRRDDSTHLSPNPMWILEAGDVLVFVGKKDTYRKMNSYIIK